MNTTPFNASTNVVDHYGLVVDHTDVATVWIIDIAKKCLREIPKHWSTDIVCTSHYNPCIIFLIPIDDWSKKGFDVIWCSLPTEHFCSIGFLFANLQHFSIA